MNDMNVFTCILKQILIFFYVLNAKNNIYNIYLILYINYTCNYYYVYELYPFNILNITILKNEYSKMFNMLLI